MFDVKLFVYVVGKDVLPGFKKKYQMLIGYILLPLIIIACTVCIPFAILCLIIYLPFWVLGLICAIFEDHPVLGQDIFARFKENKTNV